MMICSPCRIEMHCVKTGKKVIYNGDHVYSGDEFWCPGCGTTVVRTSDTPYNNPLEIAQSGEKNCIIMPDRSTTSSSASSLHVEQDSQQQEAPVSPIS